MKIIDSHCHLDGFFKTGELKDVLLRASEAGVQYLIAIGTGSEDWGVNADLAKNFAQVFYTVGLHPLNIPKYTCTDLENEIERFIVKDGNPPCAIGEIGLDYHYIQDGDDRVQILNIQQEIFYRQLMLAKKYDLPVSIHSRDAFDDTFKVLINSGINSKKVLFHCFGYSVDEMKKLMDFGAYVSFSGSVTYKNASAIREALTIADRNHVLLETDCPYLAPVPFRGKPNEPAFIRETAKFVENFLQDEHFLDQVFENTVNFFGMKI